MYRSAWCMAAACFLLSFALSFPRGASKGGTVFAYTTNFLLTRIFDTLRSTFPVLQGKNPECQKLIPHTVVRPKSTEDVKAAVNAAKAQGLPICVKSGGHSYACTHVQPNCFQIDLKEMNSVELTTDPSTDKHYLTFGTGAIFGDLLKVAPETDYTFVHGECYSVGVGGYYLHGGINAGYGSALYGWGGQSVREMEVVFANSSSTTVQDATLIGHLTRAGSSFGIVTKIKIEIYKHPSPKLWFVPILTPNWTVDELEEIYRNIWHLKKEEPEFQVNLYVHTPLGSLSVPMLQIAYLGAEGHLEDVSLAKCIEFIEQKLAIKVYWDSIYLRILRAVLPDVGYFYHMTIPPGRMIPRWEAQPYTSSNFITGEGPLSFSLVRPYLEQAWRNKSARCFFAIHVFYIPNYPYTESGYGVAIENTCVGESQALATNMTKKLMMDNPELGAYWKYYNTPTREENKCRYWPDYAELMNLKQQLDPENRFDVFQGIHTSSSSIHNDGDCAIIAAPGSQLAPEVARLDVPTVEDDSSEQEESATVTKPAHAVGIEFGGRGEYQASASDLGGPKTYKETMYLSFVAFCSALTCYLLHRCARRRRRSSRDMAGEFRNSVREVAALVRAERSDSPPAGLTFGWRRAGNARVAGSWASSTRKQKT